MADAARAPAPNPTGRIARHSEPVDRPRHGRRGRRTTDVRRRVPTLDAGVLPRRADDDRRGTGRPARQRIHGAASGRRPRTGRADRGTAADVVLPRHARADRRLHDIRQGGVRAGGGAAPVLPAQSGRPLAQRAADGVHGNRSGDGRAVYPRVVDRGGTPSRSRERGATAPPRARPRTGPSPRFGRADTRGRPDGAHDGGSADRRSTVLHTRRRPGTGPGRRPDPSMDCRRVPVGVRTRAPANVSEHRGRERHAPRPVRRASAASARDAHGPVAGRRGRIAFDPRNADRGHRRGGTIGPVDRPVVL